MKKNKKKNSNLVTYSFFTFIILLIFLMVIILFFGIVKRSDNSKTSDKLNITYYQQVDIYENIENKGNISGKSNYAILRNAQEKKEIRVKKSICIIIDDYGYQDTSSILLNLPFKISVSILPGLPYSKSGFELFINSKNITPMLHIPMESINQYAQKEKDEIEANDDKTEIERKLDLFFSQIPAKFANNHMGSKVSISENTIKIILDYLFRKGIRFIDSHTINNSLFVPIGKSLGYPIFENNIFLDYSNDENLPEKEFLKGLSILKNRNFIIIIGHNTKQQTISFLQKLASKYYYQNYEFITVRELFEKY